MAQNDNNNLAIRRLTTIKNQMQSITEIIEKNDATSRTASIKYNTNINIKASITQIKNKPISNIKDEYKVQRTQNIIIRKCILPSTITTLRNIHFKIKKIREKRLIIYKNDLNIKYLFIPNVLRETWTPIIEQFTDPDVDKNYYINRLETESIRSFKLYIERTNIRKKELIKLCTELNELVNTRRSYLQTKIYTLENRPLNTTYPEANINEYRCELASFEFYYKLQWQENEENIQHESKKLNKRRLVEYEKMKIIETYNKEHLLSNIHNVEQLLNSKNNKEIIELKLDENANNNNNNNGMDVDNPFETKFKKHFRKCYIKLDDTNNIIPPIFNWNYIRIPLDKRTYIVEKYGNKTDKNILLKLKPSRNKYQKLNRHSIRPSMANNYRKQYNNYNNYNNKFYRYGHQNGHYNQHKFMNQIGHYNQINPQNSRTKQRNFI